MVEKLVFHNNMLIMWITCYFILDSLSNEQPKCGWCELNGMIAEKDNLQFLKPSLVVEKKGKPKNTCYLKKNYTHYPQEQCFICTLFLFSIEWDDTKIRQWKEKFMSNDKSIFQNLEQKWEEIKRTVMIDSGITDVSFETWIAPLILHRLENNQVYILIHLLPTKLHRKALHRFF